MSKNQELDRRNNIFWQRVDFTTLIALMYLIQKNYKCTE